jgi:hypothetical protein
MKKLAEELVVMVAAAAEAEKNLKEIENIGSAAGLHQFNSYGRLPPELKILVGYRTCGTSNLAEWAEEAKKFLLEKFGTVEVSTSWIYYSFTEGEVKIVPSSQRGGPGVLQAEGPGPIPGCGGYPELLRLAGTAPRVIEAAAAIPQLLNKIGCKIAEINSATAGASASECSGALFALGPLRQLRGPRLWDCPEQDMINRALHHLDLAFEQKAKEEEEKDRERFNACSKGERQKCFERKIFQGKTSFEGLNLSGLRLGGGQFYNCNIQGATLKDPQARIVHCNIEGAVVAGWVTRHGEELEIYANSGHFALKGDRAFPAARWAQGPNGTSYCLQGNGSWKEVAEWKESINCEVPTYLSAEEKYHFLGTAKDGWHIYGCRKGFSPTGLTPAQRVEVLDALNSAPTPVPTGQSLWDLKDQVWRDEIPATLPFGEVLEWLGLDDLAPPAPPRVAINAMFRSAA